MMNRLFIIFSCAIISIACLCSFSHLNHSAITYLLEITFVGICILFLTRSELNPKILFLGVIFSSLLVIAYFYHPEYEYISTLKLIFCFIVFYAGYTANCGCRFIDFGLNRNYLCYVIIFTPFLLNLWQHLIGEKPTAFFLNSNNYVYFGIVASLLYYSITSSKRDSLIIMACYLLTGQTIGAVLAAILSCIILYYKKISLTYLSLSIAGLIFFIVMVANIDIALFVRIRDTAHIAYTLFTKYSIDDITAVSYGTAASYGDSGSNVSFLFRIKHWANIFELLGNSTLMELLFGHGDTSLVWLSKSKLTAHNDYLMILFDYGIIVFSLVLYFVSHIYCAIRKNFSIIFILTIFVYSISENLYSNFVANQIFYYLVGAYYSMLTTVKNESLAIG